MPPYFSKQQLMKTKYSMIPVSRLIDPPMLATQISQMGLATTALINPGDLTDEAIMIAAVINPVLVVRNGRDHEVVGNLRSFELVKRLSPECRVSVLEVSPDVASIENLARTASLITHSVNALEPKTANQQFLNAWEQAPSAVREFISPELHSRSGLRRLVGIRRGEKLVPPAALSSAFSKMLDGNEGEA